MEMVAKVLPYFLDHPERAEGVLPIFQFCLLGTKIPLSVKLEKKRLLSTATQSFVTSAPDTGT